MKIAYMVTFPCGIQAVLSGKGTLPILHTQFHHGSQLIMVEELCCLVYSSTVKVTG